MQTWFVYLFSLIISVMDPNMPPCSPSINPQARPLPDDLPPLSYIEYCIMPYLFADHIDELASRMEYKTLANTFHMYAQILLEFTETNISSGLINMNSNANIGGGFSNGISWEQSPTSTVIETITGASSVTCQLFKLLKMAFKKIPIQWLDSFYSGSIPHYVYRVIIADVVQQEQAEQQQQCGVDDGYCSDSSYNQPSMPLLFHSGSGLFQHSNTHQHGQYLLYLSSLEHYFWMLELNMAIKGQLSFSNSLHKLPEQTLKNKYEQLNHYRKNVYEAELEVMFYGDPVYGPYCSMFKRLLTKLLYVLERPGIPEVIQQREANPHTEDQKFVLLRRKSSTNDFKGIQAEGAIEMMEEAEQASSIYQYQGKQNKMVEQNSLQFQEDSEGNDENEKKIEKALHSYYLSIRPIYHQTMTAATLLNSKSPFVGSTQGHFEKYLFLKKLYKNILKAGERQPRGREDERNLEELLYLYLQQLKQATNINVNKNKLDTYTLIVGLKCRQPRAAQNQEQQVQWIGNINAQIKLLIAGALDEQVQLDVEGILLLAYSLVNCLPGFVIEGAKEGRKPESFRANSNHNLYANSLKEILELLLKVRISSNKQSGYHKLVILISLAYRMLSTGNSSNWRQLLEKMIEHPDIVDCLSNLTILDYLMGILAVHPDLNIFQTISSWKNQENSHISKIMGQEMINWKELGKQIKAYFSNGGGELATLGQQFASGSTSSSSKMNTLLIQVVSRKNTLLQQQLSRQLHSPSEHTLKQAKDQKGPNILEKYLQNRLLSFLLQQTSQDSKSQANYLISVLQEYTLIPACIAYVPANTIIKFLLALLYGALVKGGRYLQASVCLTLLEDRGTLVHWECYLGLEKIIKGNPQQFVGQFDCTNFGESSKGTQQLGSNHNEQERQDQERSQSQQINIYSCINQYDLLEILMENAPLSIRSKVYNFGEQWASNPENYQHISDPARKERALQTKRVKFIRLLYCERAAQEKQIILAS